MVKQLFNKITWRVLFLKKDRLPRNDSDFSSLID